MYLCRFLNELNAKIQKDHRENSTLPKITKIPRRETVEGNEKNQRGKDKKLLEDVDEKAKKEKEKKEKKEEEKMEKTKGKQASKLSRTIRNTSEPFMSTKQSKTLGAKVINGAVKGSVAMQSKPEKVTSAGLRKEIEISKSAKTLTSDSSEGTQTVTGLKDNNTVAAKSKHGRVSSPEPREDNLKSTKNTKDIDYTKVPKLIKSSTTGEPNVGSSSKASLESVINQTETSLVHQPSSSDHTKVTTLTLPSFTKPCQTTTTSKHQTNLLTPEQRTSEYSKVLPSKPKPSKTTSNSGPEIPKSHMSLSMNLSETFTTDFSTQSFTPFVESSQTHSTTTLPKGISNPKLSKTGLTSVAKPTKDTACAPSKPSKGLPKDRELTEVSTEDSFNTSYKVLKEDHGDLKMSSATKTAGCHYNMPLSNASGKDLKEDSESSDPSTIQQQSTSKSKIIPESRTTSNTLLSEIPKTNTPAGTTIPKTLKVSDKENREDLALSVSISATTNSLINQTSKVSGTSNNKQKNSSEVESDVKSMKRPDSKFQVKLASPSNHATSTTTMTLKTTTFPTEVRRKSDNSERNDTVNISTVADSTLMPSTASQDHRASKRGFVLHMDTTDLNGFGFTALPPSPPPPPPPPSSTPLPLPSSSIPSICVASSNSPVSDHLTLGAGFYPGNHSLR